MDEVGLATGHGIDAYDEYWDEKDPIVLRARSSSTGKRNEQNKLA